MKMSDLYANRIEKTLKCKSCGQVSPHFYSGKVSKTDDKFGGLYYWTCKNCLSTRSHPVSPTEGREAPPES